MNGISDTELQAFIDGELDAASHARVAQCVADGPELARRVAELRSQTALLRRYFMAAGAHMPDRRMAETVRLVVERPSPRRRAVRAVQAGIRSAAMVACLLIGVGAVVGIKLSMTVPAYADAAALVYEDVAGDPREPGDVVDPDPRALVDWLEAGTGLSFRVPYFEKHGFWLTDGRLSRFHGEGAALLMYEDSRHHRVGIFFTRVAEGDDPELHFAKDRATHVAYWSRDGVGVVIAAADRRDLDAFTAAVAKLIEVSPRRVSVPAR